MYYMNRTLPYIGRDGFLLVRIFYEVLNDALLVTDLNYTVQTRRS